MGLDFGFEIHCIRFCVLVFEMDRFPFFLPTLNKIGSNDFDTKNASDDSAKNAQNLVDAETKNYLYNVLNHCHQNQLALYSQIWNWLAWVIIGISVSCLLYVCWKYRPTPEQKRNRRLKTQKMVLTKMREMQEMNMYTKPNGITLLPMFQNKGY